MIDVVAGTICRDGRFLAGQRRSGVWEFPGGKVEPGETQHEALSREMREELAIEATVKAFVASHQSPRLSVSLFITEADGEPQPLEHLSLAWIDEDDAYQLHWQPHDLPLLEALLRYLREEAP